MTKLVKKWHAQSSRGEIVALRNYRPGDEKELVKVFNEVFRQNRALPLWKWKYQANPAGCSIVVATNSAGKIVGHQNFIYRHGLYKGKEYLFFEIADVCLKLKYRGISFYEEAVRFYPPSPVFCYGFPNNVAYNTMKKQSPRFQLYDLNIYSKKYGFRDRTRSGSHRNKQYCNFEQLTSSAENHGKINALWEKKKGELIAGVVRDWPYLRWRHLDSPNKPKLFLVKLKGDVIGYFSIWFRAGVCYISDILLLNKMTERNVLLEIENICVSYGPLAIVVLIHDKFLEDLFMKIGFSGHPENHFMCENKIEPGVPVIPYLTFSDSDFG